MRRPRRTDSNHAEIREVMRKCGCVVEDLSDVGRGIPDLLVLTPKGRVLLVEVKDGSKPPSARVRTDPELAFASRWGRNCIVVETVEQAIMAATL